MVFNSPDVSYQYDTGVAPGTPAPSSASSASSAFSSKPARLTLGAIKKEPEEAEAAAPVASVDPEDLKKATHAITENRIKLASKNLYSYKVIGARETGPPHAFFVRQKESGEAVNVARKPPKPSFVIASPPPSFSSKPHSYSYGVVRTPPSPSPAPSYAIKSTPRPARTISIGYAPLPSPSPYTYHSSSHRLHHHASPSPAATAVPPSHHGGSYGVSLPLSYNRYPSSLTANTLVHRPASHHHQHHHHSQYQHQHHSRPHLSTPSPPIHSIAIPPSLVGRQTHALSEANSGGPSYSSIVKSRASKGNTKVVRPSFQLGGGASKKGGKGKAASLTSKKRKKSFNKTVVQMVEPGTKSATLSQVAKAKGKKKKMKGSMGELEELIGLAAASAMPDKRRNMGAKQRKKKKPKVIKVNELIIKNNNCGQYEIHSVTTVHTRHTRQKHLCGGPMRTRMRRPMRQRVDGEKIVLGVGETHVDKLE